MKVAVIGVGTMGSAIAERLLATGATVAVHDSDPQARAAGEAMGAIAAASGEEAAAFADYVIISLNTAGIVEAAVFGEGGVARAGTPEKILIDMSSIDPARTSELSRRLVESTGMRWVDAPLSGGAPAARAGQLTLMVGGDSADFDAARSVLERLASRITHVGQSGAGQTVKLVNQILCALNFLAVAEAVRFAEANGIDAAAIPDALAGGRADSRILQEFMAKMARRDFTPTGRIDNMLKDLETVQAAASAHRVALPLTSLASDLHRMLVAAGHGPADSAEYMRLFDMGRGNSG
ncbi:NAD(P)-dependent oxidoreductase [Sphingopyxis sp. FD7]|uniref:NAD(P)-dependent oxidoreductase n=1 Tax=Sphingopyxis sp. FD7 TaxID=1914525 RepID=UPI000DC63F70|nr:NAD(P)-dependent oxidoreductase [Sphingopyxis sp. FD7]BBB14530.1 2-hydroxy-3-oxopropionate reductase [Sphingopyxis sp. FD7]